VSTDKESSRSSSEKENIVSKKALVENKTQMKETKKFDMSFEKLKKNRRIEIKPLFSSLTFSVPRKGEEDVM